MTRTNTPVFSLEVGPHAAATLVVIPFSGSEAQSRLHDFRDFEKLALDLSTKSQRVQEASGLELYDYPAEYMAPGVGKVVVKSWWRG